MANISLIPQNQKKRSTSKFGSFKGLKSKFAGVSRVGIIILLIGIIGIFAFSFWNGSLDSKKFELENSLSSIILERDKSLEKELKKVNTRLESFEELINDHRSWSEALRIIEEQTITEVAFTNLNANYFAGTIQLEGLSPNYNILAQQIRSFEQVEGVVRVDVAKIGVNKESQVGFTIIITFVKDLIKKLPTP